MKFSFLKNFHQLEVVFFLTNLSVFFYTIIMDDGDYNNNDAIETITFLVIYISLTVALPSIIFHNMIKRKPFEVIAITFLVGCNLLSAFFWSHEATIQKNEPLYIIFFFFHWIISYLIVLSSPLVVWFVADVKKDFEK